MGDDIRHTIGLHAPVICRGSKQTREYLARIDTGAGKSSIDIEVAMRLGVGEIIGEKMIRNAHGREMRKLVQLTIELAGQEITAQFTLADRKGMRYPVLIGRNVLKKGNYMIDPKLEVEG
jgi:hypothetical protein